MNLKFLATVKEVKIKEAVSNDKEVRIILETVDNAAVQLQEAIASCNVIVTIEEEI